ncbi:MAG: ATP synthase F0 subunit B [Eubacteriales bacterium]|nr:ATP synthase F0 subunit B [Eubacteriales bacterium]
MLTLNMNIVWTFVNLIVLFILLRVFLFKPVTNIINQRQRILSEQMNQADSMEKTAKEHLNEADKVLQSSNSLAQAHADKIIEDAKLENARIINEAKEEADRILTDSRLRAKREAELLMNESKGQIAELALAAAKKLAKVNRNEAEEQSLFNDVLREASIRHDA